MKTYDCYGCACAFTVAANRIGKGPPLVIKHCPVCGSTVIQEVGPEWPLDPDEVKYLKGAKK